MTMKLLQDIEDAKAAAAGAKAATDELLEVTGKLDFRAAELAKAIAEAPAARTFKIRVGEADHEISEREALTFGAACFVSLVSGQSVQLKTIAGELVEVKTGDLFVGAQAILAQSAA